MPAGRTMNPKLLDWCRRMIRCRSVTTEGTREMAQLCANELLAPAGIAARLIPSAAEGNAQVNLIATIEGRGYVARADRPQHPSRHRAAGGSRALD